MLKNIFIFTLITVITMAALAWGAPSPMALPGPFASPSAAPQYYAYPSYAYPYTGYTYPYGYAYYG
ncbi:hypothetical protein ABEB36_001282 [Hypothenemus hampei]|uniref:Neuropeptide-like 4 n=1 Tax=Hypothenemus hampei TaxID=57062 RepID=A0ABD1FE16_HYPHA